jgi:hypothetical protein
MSLLYAYYMTLGQKSKFARFDGSTARITAIPDIGLSGQSWAIEARTRTLDYTARQIVLTIGTSGNNMLDFWFEPNGFFKATLRAGVSTVPVPDNGVNFVVVRVEYNASTGVQNIYVNGEFKITKTLANLSGTLKTHIASRCDGTYPFGKVDIDYVKVWRNGVEVLNTGFDDNTINDKYGNTGVQEGTIQFLEE